MEALRQAASAAGVIALLLIALWWLRRNGLAAPAWRPARKRERHMRLVENLRLTPSHTLHLVRFRDVELLISASPQGCVVLRSVAPEIPESALGSAA